MKPNEWDDDYQHTDYWDVYGLVRPGVEALASAEFHTCCNGCLTELTADTVAGLEKLKAEHAEHLTGT